MVLQKEQKTNGGYKHLKNTKIKRGTGDKIKNNDKIDTTDS